jgi:hypothetical protein
MTRGKQNKVIPRIIVAGGTLLACVGIWTSVVDFSRPAQTTVAAPLVVAAEPNANANLNNFSISGIQQGIQTGQGTPPLPTSNQTTPVPTSPPTQTPTQPPPAVTTPPVTTTDQPQPTTTVPIQPPPATTPPIQPPPVITPPVQPPPVITPPVQPPPAPTPPPTVITRGS